MLFFPSYKSYCLTLYHSLRMSIPLSVIRVISSSLSHCASIPSPPHLSPLSTTILILLLPFAVTPCIFNQLPTTIAHVTRYLLIFTMIINYSSSPFFSPFFSPFLSFPLLSTTLLSPLFFSPLILFPLSSSPLFSPLLSSLFFFSHPSSPSPSLTF